ncbi:hypothetical protein [Bacillus solitudinis]|uniref:hypothetical protein n=1 Tax=Bacillus solitudinis TaxID=2014074 RepID=UPI000C2323CC|nr:hypothetical protein [Bacillus solitudinis]
MRTTSYVLLILIILLTLGACRMDNADQTIPTEIQGTSLQSMRPTTVAEEHGQYSIQQSENNVQFYTRLEIAQLLPEGVEEMTIEEIMALIPKGSIHLTEEEVIELIQEGGEPLPF